MVAIQIGGYFVARWIIAEYNKCVDNDSISTPDISGVQDRPSLDHRRTRLFTKIEDFDGPNPFTLRRLSSYEKLKIYFFCLTGLVFLRVLAVLALLAIAYMLSLSAGFCPDTSNRYRQLQSLVRWTNSWLLLILGFYSISTVGRSPQKSADSYRVIVANHNTIFDGLILMSVTNGIPAAKKELSQLPVVGRILKMLQFVWIDRYQTKTRDAAKQQIMRHILDHEKPPLIVFPQGTCSNVRTITTFKTGAFLSAQKVKPVALDWSGNSHDVSYVAHNTLAHFLYVGCCQFRNHCTVKLLPTYAPDEEEKTNVSVFADNVRANLISALNDSVSNGDEFIMSTPHSFSDILLHSAADKNRVRTAHITMSDVYSTLRLRTNTVLYLAERFAALDTNTDGFIQYEEFVQLFGAKGDELRSLFEIFDGKQIDDQMSFDEFLSGVVVCYSDDMIKDAVLVMFKACQGKRQKSISKEDVIRVSEMYSGCNNFRHRHWMKEMQTFCDDVFVNAPSLTFSAFFNEIMQQQYQYLVQEFLQNVIMKKFDVELKKEDFIL